MLKLQRLPFPVLAFIAFCCLCAMGAVPSSGQAPVRTLFARIIRSMSFAFRCGTENGCLRRCMCQRRAFTGDGAVSVSDGPDALQRGAVRGGPVPKHLGPSEEFEKAGYIFVYQDVRGRWMSEGEFVEMRPHIDNKKGPQEVDDASDTYDTIEFLLKHVPNNNGKAGIWGISYPGFYTSASMIDSHPALVAASPRRR